MGKDSEWSGLLKIPEEVVISELRIKLGQQESYIAELEDKIKELDVKKVKLTKLQHLENEIERLSKKLKDTENRLGDIGRRNAILESELFRLLRSR